MVQGKQGKKAGSPIRTVRNKNLQIKRSPTLIRRHAEMIFRAALASVRADTAVFHCLSREKTEKGERLRCGRLRIPLRPGGRLIVVGAGKAAADMARAAEKILGRRIHGGAVATKYGHGKKCRRVEVIEAGHPVPDAAGVRAAGRIGDWVDAAGPEDLVLFFLSGGASALMPAPAEGLTLADKQKVTDAMLRGGAPIEALNCVRKHLSQLKGGHLARRAAPARVLALVVSDVIGDPLDVIGSGPAAGDFTTFSDARRLMKRFGAWQSAQKAVRRHIERGVAGLTAETPLPGSPSLGRVRHVVVANNETALKAARAKARSLGYRATVLTRRLRGEAREMGILFASLAAEMKAEGRPLRPPACLLTGGETTVTVRGKGVGGRCQEMALSFAIEAAGREEVGLLAAGTDGTDGPTDAAGAFSDGQTAKWAKRGIIDMEILLQDNNSNEFFRKARSLYITGPTGTNVMDITVLIVR